MNNNKNNNNNNKKKKNKKKTIKIEKALVLRTMRKISFKLKVLL